MKQIVPLLLLLISWTSLVFGQNFNFKKIPNPPNLHFGNYFAHQTENLAYLGYEDDDYRSFLFTYDGNELVEMPVHDSLIFATFEIEHEGKVYLGFYNENFELFLLAHNSDGFTIILATIGNESMTNDKFINNGRLYYFFWDADYNRTLKRLDNDNFIDIPLPENVIYYNYLGALGGKDYITFEDTASLELILYAFDGLGFTPVVSVPEGYTVTSIITKHADKFYLSFYDANSMLQLFVFNGNTLTKVALPTDYPSYSVFIAKWKEKIFVNLEDAQGNGTLHHLGPDDVTWTTYTNPTDLKLHSLPFWAKSETALHLSYYDNPFQLQMVIFDGTNFEPIANPNLIKYAGYYTDYKGGGLVGYWNQVDFDLELWYFNGTEIVEIPMQPETNRCFYKGNFLNRAFLSYEDDEDNQTLYYLPFNEIPQSADHTVSTPMETAYDFSAVDFTFIDENIGDELTGIQIVALPTTGNLNLAGVSVETGAFIPVEELSLLQYQPLDDGVGAPYDSFQFKVSDGYDFSLESYTMFVNVTMVSSLSTDRLAEAIEVFPNPAVDLIYLNKKGTFQDEINVSLVHVSGKTITSTTFEPTQNQIIIDTTTELAAGIYYLVLQTDEGSEVKKVLIQN